MLTKNHVINNSMWTNETVKLKTGVTMNGLNVRLIKAYRTKKYV